MQYQPMWYKRKKKKKHENNLIGSCIWLTDQFKIIVIYGYASWFINWKQHVESNSIMLPPDGLLHIVVFKHILLFIQFTLYF